MTYETEAIIQRRCLKWLRENDFFAVKIHIGAIKIQGKSIPNPAAGHPDILAIRDGKYFGIEVKKPGGKVSPKQDEFHKKIEKAGGAVIVAYSLQSMIDQIPGWN